MWDTKISFKKVSLSSLQPPFSNKATQNDVKPSQGMNLPVPLSSLKPITEVAPFLKIWELRKPHLGGLFLGD